jgi:hypothetical protein
VGFEQSRKTLTQGFIRAANLIEKRIALGADGFFQGFSEKPFFAFVDWVHT